MKPVSLFRQQHPGTFGLQNGSSAIASAKFEEVPLRGQILTREALEKLAKELAQSEVVHISRSGERKLYRRYEDNARTIERAYFDFADFAQKKEFITPGMEWLLDNYHIVEEQIRDIRLHLPRGYYRTLPKLKEGDLKGSPRVYRLALVFVQHTDASVIGDLLSHFISAYQAHSALAIGELWAIPIMLRLALIENLRRLVVAGLAAREGREIAQGLLSSVLEKKEITGTDRLLILAETLKERPELLPHEAAYLIRPLRARGKETAMALHWLEERVREQGHEPDDLIWQEQQDQAANQISIGNTITSLKTIGTLDWYKWFEGVSKVDAVLRKDPANLYYRCDFATKNRYRSMVESLARHGKSKEVEIAGMAIKLAEDASKDDTHNEPSAALHNMKKHVGYYLIDDGLKLLQNSIGIKISYFGKVREWLREHIFPVYLSAILFITALTISLVFMLLNLSSIEPWIAVVTLALFAIPASTFGIDIVHWVVTRRWHPFHLPKLNYENGIPPESRTCVVVHSIFSDRESIRKAVEMLEVRYLANQYSNLYFTLLADLHDADKKHLETDDSLVSYAHELFTQLNERHNSGDDPRFLLLFRERLWNPEEEKWMGWERKRGKVAEFNKLILDKGETSFRLIEGNLETLHSIKYVITLDGDTQLPWGAAWKLVGTISHPLNAPVFDEERRVVQKGYTVIQPRAAVSLASAQASSFAEMFSGQAGLDPYTQTVSDVYQDLFEEGSYIGKGIYNVKAFEKALENRVPENALLSHDLFEGLFARVALATDIELPDDFPAHYIAYTKREHRWVRGDWQLLPWIFKKIPDSKKNKYKSPISALGRWKLVDNLRRSLLAPSMFLFLFFVWFFLPTKGSTALLIALTVMSFPFFAGVINALFVSPFGISLRTYFDGITKDLGKNAGQILLRFSCLGHKAYLMVHAVSITLYRILISRKRLLEWETAHSSEKRVKTNFSSIVLELAPGVLLAVMFGGGLFLAGKEYFFPAIPALALWMLSPLFVYWGSRQRRQREYTIPQKEREYLIKASWDTWKFFQELMTKERNYLIPDNIQNISRPVIAERTSPTNMSLSLLSTVAAYDLGFSNLPTTIEQLERIVRSLITLERFHGHFLNWYHTQTRAALTPRYVSTVDSGNMAANLIAFRVALEEFYYSPLILAEYWKYLNSRLSDLSKNLSPAHQGIKQATDRLHDQIADLPNSFVGVLKGLKGMQEFLDDPEVRQRELVFSDQESSITFDLLIDELRSFSNLRTIIGWIEEIKDDLKSACAESPEDLRRLEGVERILESRPPSLALVTRIQSRLQNIAQESDSASENVSKVLAAIKASKQQVDKLTAALRFMHEQANLLVQEMDFGFLYDEEKKLFVIGYNVDTGKRDKGYYDLLASEARLASLISIAKRDVPEKHWFSLGRLLTDAAGRRALMSWSGSMFEYLLPLTVSRDYPGTLLSGSYQNIVRAQRSYASKRGVPWGISESGYAGVNFEDTYQYRAFGVPGLGLKRGLSGDLVISPYSTFLALHVDPKNSLKNLHALEKIGMRDKYGYYEAIDFTADRLVSKEKYHIVKSYLAHHQGMSLISATNVLCNGVFQERFHRDSSIKAVDLLLHEKFPLRVPTLVPHQAELARIGGEEDVDRFVKDERYYTPHTAVPRTRVLSNGNYSVMTDNAGGGFSKLNSGISLTRWREDPTISKYGMFIFVRDLDSGKVWSVAYQPTQVEPQTYEVIFGADKIEFKRRDAAIGLHTEITVSPEHDVELRRVTVTNFSLQMKTLELTSFAEVVLGSEAADLAHPAFSKMFIESEYVEEFDSLVFSRRPRSIHEKNFYLFHMASMRICWEKTQCETSREHFLGRGRNIHNPHIFDHLRPLSGTTGPVLDPILSLRTVVEVEPGESESVTFVTGVGSSREEVLELAGHYHELYAITRAFELSWSRSNVELRNQLFTARQAQLFQRLANALFFNIEKHRGDKGKMLQNRLTQSGLWRFSVSGDFPIVLLTLTDPNQIELLQELLLAHEYLRLRGVRFDLVVLNEYPGGYFQNFQEDLENMIRHSFSGKLIDQNGGIFLRTVRHLSTDEITLLHAIARVVIPGSKGSLKKQLELKEKIVPAVRRNIDLFSYFGDKPAKYEPAEKVLEFYNGIGGFDFDGQAYSMQVRADKLPPQPWSNVIANEDFGFLITESGAGYTWSGNSRENRLTSWSNDPVSDPVVEAIYIRDSDSGAFWNPTPLPCSSDDNYSVVHRLGASEFSTQVQGIYSQLTVSGAETSKVKWYHLNLMNGDYKDRTLEIFFYVDWVLGAHRSQSYRTLITDYDELSDSLYAVNHYNNEFAGRHVSIGCSEPIVDYTTHRAEFIGRNRTLTSPYVLESAATRTLASLVRRKSDETKLSCNVGAGLDSCGVIRIKVDLKRGEEKDILFYLTESDSLNEMQENASDFRLISTYQREVEKTGEFWSKTTSTVQVKTPERSFDLMLNGWLLYQTLSCRIRGRTGFFQSGGAYGFRDQLQDVLALLYSNPELARQQILLHASRQFVEGDVQHWWHPPTGRGVRTRISDDYLWLPYVVCRYIEVTNDHEILNENVGFLEGEHLEPGQMEIYIVPRTSSHLGSLYEHCVIALDRALHVGDQGLPLIQGGDWNDGMNEVGMAGKGQSVWLAWFLINILDSFGKVVEKRKDRHRAKEYKQVREKLRESIEQNAWDGEWYLRGFFDDGSPLGSAENEECMIDSLSQSWSIISGAGDLDRQKIAIENVYEKLVDRENGIVKLLSPPFDKGAQNPGYIKGYLPGIRENGGQYTHAAAWVVMATALLGDGKRAMELFSLINPINHTNSPVTVQRYKGEPYVTCGDVYSVHPHAGRAGWSWYTGSAGWLYTVGVENILGLQVLGDVFTVDPCIPPEWKEFEIRYRTKSSLFIITVKNPDGVEHGVSEIRLEGELVSNKHIPVTNSCDRKPQEQRVEVLMGIT